MTISRLASAAAALMAATLISRANDSVLLQVDATTWELRIGYG